VSVNRQILSMVEAMRQVLSELSPPDPAAQAELSRALVFLKELPPVTGTFPLNNHPSGQALREAKWSAAVPSSLLESFLSVARFLPWEYRYAERADAPGLGGRMGFAEVIGPASPIHSDTICLGWTFISPRTLYPLHLHPAIELYYVVSGKAAWTLEGTVQDRAPGSFILHPSNTLHAMETRDEPLLAVYVWTGTDIETTSAYA